MISVPYSHAPEFLDALNKVFTGSEMIEVTGASRAQVYDKCQYYKMPLHVSTDVQRGTLIVHRPAHRPEMKRRKR